MSARPTRKVVSSRPPTDRLNGNVRRRTSEQVKKDVETKKAATAAAERSIDASKRQKQAHIANLEDNLRKEDVLWEKQSFRPDLRDIATEKTVKPNMTNPKVSMVLTGRHFCCQTDTNDVYKRPNLSSNKSTLTKHPSHDEPDDDDVLSPVENSDSEVQGNEGDFILLDPYSIGNHCKNNFQGNMSEGMGDIPEESNVDTESDGLGLGEYENLSDHDRALEKEGYSDGDHDNDGDYIDTHTTNPAGSEEDQDELEEQVEEVSKTARKRRKKASSSLALQITK
jgi:hypothetical protein